jgi:hypothetical protein
MPLEETELNEYGKKKIQLLSKGIAGLDMAKGLARYDGDEEVYLKILRSYAGSVKSILGLIETVTEDRLADYKIKVHGIKGASYDILANEIGKEAEALENASKAEDFKFIVEHNPAFLAAAGKLVNDIEDMLSAINDETPKPKKDKPDDELLLKLLAACKDYSMRDADEAMEKIEKYQYEADDGLADWLRNNVDMLNFQQIVEKLESLYS